MTARLEVQAVGPAEVDAVGQLFASARTARHCWCMSFCSSSPRFAAGWFGGGNRRRFQTMAEDGTPMGVLASVGGAPAGWAACGPRSRYLVGSPARRPLLARRPPTEDDGAWLLPCLFVHPEHRGSGVSHILIQGAVQLALECDAVALEGWPIAAAATREADAFVGREELFTEFGFRRIGGPLDGRVIVRRELGSRSAAE